MFPVRCQRCCKSQGSPIPNNCRLCADLNFSETILCELNRSVQQGGDTFKCDAFRPKLSVVNRDDTEQSRAEDVSENTEGMSLKEKWFKAYAVQQLEMNPDLIYANLRFHVVVSTTQRIKLFSNQHVDQIDEIFNQAEFPFDNTNVHLLCLAPDHIHLYVESSPDYSLDEIVHAVMEYSEREIPIQLPELQQNSQLLWERSYFSEGIG